MCDTERQLHWSLCSGVLCVVKCLIHLCHKAVFTMAPHVLWCTHIKAVNVQLNTLLHQSHDHISGQAGEAGNLLHHGKVFIQFRTGLPIVAVSLRARSRPGGVHGQLLRDTAAPIQRATEVTRTERGGHFQRAAVAQAGGAGGYTGARSQCWSRC